MKSQFIIIRTTFSKKLKARKLAKILIEKKLAACVQISKIESFYFWNKKISNSDEILVEIKTKANLYKKIEKEILINHEYEIPQILTININEAFSGYEKWLDGSLSQKN